jgi:hypothetical protein
MEGNRLRSYYMTSVLTSTKNSLIYNNILKYVHYNFSLIILEECNFLSSLNVKERKKYYLVRA